ncbi:MAG TPA: hypothetical protein V6D25_29270 [Leptolyngbyaceae cyanobacterium]
MCQNVTEVLENYRLLRPSQIVFSGWLQYDADIDSLTKVEKPDIIITLSQENNSSSLLASCEKIVEQLEIKQSFLYPSDIEISGTGIIFDAHKQPQEFPDVTWLLGKTLDAHIVDVNTQSDAWLPYTLLAEPQTKIWEYNAPRLKAALEEITMKLGVTPVTDSHSEYAVIEGFTLINHTDVNDDIIPVYDSN